MINHKSLPPLFIALFIAIVSLAVFFVSLPAAYNLDFFPVYGQILGLHNGIPLYREEHLYSWLQSIYPTLRADEVPPLAQPPWYYASLYFLAYFDLENAAKIWFALNTTMLLLSVVLLTSGWSARKQIFALVAGFLFPPAIGNSVVGQFSMPVLFGIALSAWGIRRERPVIAGLGLFLMTFKPHVGALPLLASMLFMYSQQRSLLPRVLGAALSFLAVGITASFLLDAGWLTHYPNALARVSARPQNIECDTCISLTYAASEQFGLDNGAKWKLGAALLALSTLLIFFYSRKAGRDGSGWLLGLAALFGLLLNPYIRNYDALIALPSFLILEQLAPRRYWRFMTGALYLGSYPLLFTRGALSQLFWIIPAGLALLNIMALSRHNSAGPDNLP